MAGDVVVATVAPRLTAVVAETTTWEAFPSLWAPLLDEVYAVVRPRPELSPEPGPGPKWQNVMLYKDDAPAVEVGVLVGRTFEAVGRVVPSQLPAGRVAVAVHRGDYAGLGRAHDAVHRFAAARGLDLAGSRWEIYGHWSADPRDIETEVYWLLR
jgi:effector-binding domain-containing protein